MVQGYEELSNEYRYPKTINKIGDTYIYFSGSIQEGDNINVTILYTNIF